MPITGLPSSLPLAATIDLKGRLPPPQQIIYTPTILVTAILLGIGIIVLIILSRKAKIRAKHKLRQDTLKMIERILIKRGGSPEDVDAMLAVFSANPELNPTSAFMSRERFDGVLGGILEKTRGSKFRERMEKIFFPPPKDARMALGADTGAHSTDSTVEEPPSIGTAKTAAAIQDLMDSTLRPGVLVRLTFEEIEGGYECLVMGHDTGSISVTLPANSDHLVASLKPDVRVEGTFERGPSLLAFTSAVVQAIAGSMPYCRILPWRSVWEVRKRESVRLPSSIEIGFQHISTAQENSIKISSLDKEIGIIRPGRLVDLSLGGCCIETPSESEFNIGDMIRFSKALIPSSPPATLLGSIVKITELDPLTNDGFWQRLHIQFLVIDDVSQRLLVRALKQFQEAMERDEWVQAQQMMQQMRRHNINNIGSPVPSAFTGKSKKKTTGSAPRVPPSGSVRRPSTRSFGKAPPSGRTKKP